MSVRLMARLIVPLPRLRFGIRLKEEHKYFDETASIYLQAFREARAELKVATQNQTPQGSTSTFDVQA